MSEPTSRPDRRVGDAERDAAVNELQRHHAEGRLDAEEFSERMHAGFLPADEPLWVNGIRLIALAAFPVAIILLITQGWFWPMLFAIFLAPGLGAIADNARKRAGESRRARKELP